MRKQEQVILDDLIVRYPVLSVCRNSIQDAFDLLVDCYKRGGKLLIAGNGGSAADSGHIVGELMKSFRLRRQIPNELKARLIAVDAERGLELATKLESPLEAISLVEHHALSTAFSNDVDAGLPFAQQLLGYGKPGDVFLGISTSGNSRNIIDAAIVAKALGIGEIGLTGMAGGRLADIADIVIRVPAKETFKIQELHLPVYHCICMMVESFFFYL